MKEAVADPKWGTIATTHIYIYIYIVDSSVYLGTVNNGNKTWHVCSPQHYVHDNSSKTLVCADMCSVQ